MPDETAIEFSCLTKEYDGIRALDGISFAVRRGEVMGFLGPNGAGKTTAIRILFDLIRPTAGNARVFGLDCQRQALEARSRMGYLPGELRLYDGLTGKETIAFFQSLRPQQRDDRFVGGLVERLNLDPSRRVGDYSKGNKQKLGLVLAMLSRPDLLVLDEPTSGLDPLVQEEVAGILAELAEDGVTTFFSSHVLSEVERSCRRVAFLRGGRLVAVEDVGALKGRSLHILEVTFLDPPPATAFDLPGVRVVDSNGNRVHLEIRQNLDATLKAIAGFEVVDLRTEQPSLDQIFRAYYEADARGEAAK
jgi:ABC-2 type transport system ATP-binding protein